MESLFSSLSDGFKDSNRAIIEMKRQLTPDFNAFLILDALEVQISRVIGELLNPKGTHEQGRIFLDLFIDSFIRNGAFLKKLEDISVVIEQTIEGGRIDILLDFDTKFAIAIENKPFSEDIKDQIDWYCDYLAKRYGGNKYIMSYISPEGTPPSEESISEQKRKSLGDYFIPVSYRHLIKWLDECARIAKLENAHRLAFMIEEFGEYINRKILGENALKNNLLGESIKKNILEAHEIVNLWEKNRSDYESYWAELINKLFNEKLPELVFNSLRSDGIIGDNWEWEKGNFDVRIMHVQGIQFRKKAWKHFKLGILSSAFKTPPGKRNIFPAILSRQKIHKENYNNIYCKEIGCKRYEKPFLIKKATQWYSDFPNIKFQDWGYEEWAEIKPGGNTVAYVTEFLGKLIKVCEADIDTEEKLLRGSG